MRALVTAVGSDVYHAHHRELARVGGVEDSGVKDSGVEDSEFIVADQQGAEVDQPGVLGQLDLGLKLSQISDIVDIDAASGPLTGQLSVHQGTGKLRLDLGHTLAHTVDRVEQALPGSTNPLQLLAGDVAATGHIGEDPLPYRSGLAHHALALFPGCFPGRLSRRHQLGPAGLRLRYRRGSFLGCLGPGRGGVGHRLLPRLLGAGLRSMT